ncbi:MAG: nuclear transport factor 2 family protein [Chloroflexota bacterium]|nr:nuclear transport factor 2 family protein [Chloroflexota bacterium]
MELSDQEKRDLELLEEGLWRADVRFDRKRMDRILAPDFFEFGRSGRIYRRAATLAIPAQPIVARLPLIDFRARLLDANLAQVTYVSTVTYQGVDERSTRSSLWSRTANGWQLRFHQGTAMAADHA